MFKDLKEGLKEILDYRKGKIELRSEEIKIIDPTAYITNESNILEAICECFKNNNVEGILEMVEIYLEGLERMPKEKKDDEIYIPFIDGKLRLDFVAELTYTLKPEKNGYSVQCDQFEGIITQGNSAKEIMKNVVEATELYFKDEFEDFWMMHRYE